MGLISRVSSRTYRNFENKSSRCPVKAKAATIREIQARTNPEVPTPTTVAMVVATATATPVEPTDQSPATTKMETLVSPETKAVPSTEMKTPLAANGPRSEKA